MMKKGPRRAALPLPDWLRGEDSNLHTRIQSPVCCPLHHPAGPFSILHRERPPSQGRGSQAITVQTPDKGSLA